MTRVLLTNGELRDPLAADFGITLVTPDGFSLGTTTTAYETTNQLFGSACYKFVGDTTATSFQDWNHSVPPAIPSAIFGRAYFQVVDTLPTSTCAIFRFNTGGNALYSVRLNSSGHLEYWYDIGSTQIGSASAYTVTVGKWFRVQMRASAASTTSSTLEMTVGDQGYYEEFDPHESITGSIGFGSANIGRTRAGYITAPGVTSTLLVAGLSVNNSSVQPGGPGNQSNSFPGRSSVILFKPVSTASAGTWTDCSGGSNLHAGVDNTPPVGVADHVTAGHSANPDQIRAITSGTAVVRTASYAAMGVNGPVECGVLTGDGTNGEIGAATANTKRAQSFLINGALMSFELTLGKTGTPTDDLTLDICSDSSGAPGTVLDTMTIPGSNVTGTPVSITVAPNVSIPGGLGTLWAVLSRTGTVDASNYFIWRRGDTADPYPDGTAATYNGTSWSNETWDYKLTVRVRRADKIGVVMPFCCHGEGIATGTKTGSIATSNPPMSTAYAFTYGGDIGAAGTYPTNWRWAWPGSTASSAPNNPPSDDTSKINYGRGVGLSIACTTASSRAVMICSAGAYVEVKNAYSGWMRLQKTSDSSIWWAKQVSANIEVERDDGSVLSVPFGSWIAYPDPQIDAGGDYPATTVALTDTDLQANYTEA